MSKKEQGSGGTKLRLTAPLIYPVDAGGDGREVGTLVFLFDEVTQAGEGKSWRSCDKSLIFRPGKDEAGYENEHKHQTELADWLPAEN